MQMTWKATIGGQLSEKLINSSIQHICQSLHESTESFLLTSTDTSENTLRFLSAQAVLLLHFIRFTQRTQSLQSSILIINTITSSLKSLKDSKTLKLLLMSLLSCINSPSLKESESSNVFLQLLPILSTFTEPIDHFTLSISTIDSILKRISTPTTWFPIIQEHLRIQNIVKKLHDKNYSDSTPVVLNFLLTFARVKKGAEMLVNMGFFSSLRVLLDEKEKPQIWGLGLAVVSTVINSLRDSSLVTEIMEYVVSCFVLEKSDLVFYCLNTPNFAPVVKKRARVENQTSLTDLKESQHTLLLICILAKDWNLWSKVMKEMDGELRERSIRLLAFISRGPENNGKKSWFLTLSSSSLLASSGLVIKDSSGEDLDGDVAGVEVYRIAFFVLKFLCLQAAAAAKRAEEVGFVDVARFPDLPMPDILHGLQDQGIAIVRELCEGKKLTQEIKSVCILLLQITEKSLYLEFCVSQVCGIRPVMGRVEDFSKELKSLFTATKGHVFLEEWVKSLKQITSYVYPGLLE